MPRVDEFILLICDSLLQAAGVGLLGWLALRLVGQARAGKDILLAPSPSSRSVEGLETVGVLVLYVALAGAGSAALGLAEHAGEGNWRAAGALDSACKLVCSGVMIWLLWKRPCFEPAGLRPTAGRLMMVGVGAALIAFPLTYSQLAAAKTIWRWFSPEVTQPTHAALKALRDATGDPLAVAQLAFSAVVVAPLAEELFFRGIALQAAWRATRLAWPAILVTAVLFGWIHNAQPQDVLPLISLGILLGVVRLRTRSLAPCVIAHALFNARTLVIALLNPQLTEVW